MNCGCQIKRAPLDNLLCYIAYCPLHASAERLREALEKIEIELRKEGYDREDAIFCSVQDALSQAKGGKQDE